MEQKNFEIPSPPDYEIHTLFPPIETLIPLLDWNMLVHRFMGAKTEKEQIARLQLDSFLESALSEGAFKPASVFRFVKAKSDGDDIILLPDDNRELTKITFTRNCKNTCAADWIFNNQEHSDNVAVFVVTAGDVSKRADKARLSNNMLYAYSLEALSIAFTEANADYTHGVIRKLWQIDNSRGARLSPGYSCCPDLTTQSALFEILNPEKIDVYLTDEYMMEPEGSISAIVFHHREAKSY